MELTFLCMSSADNGMASNQTRIIVIIIIAIITIMIIIIIYFNYLNSNLNCYFNSQVEQGMKTEIKKS